jgi:hypothetical protein
LACAGENFHLWLTAMTKHWISGARDHPIPTACAGWKNGEVTIAILRLVANNSNR